MTERSKDAYKILGVMTRRGREIKRQRIIKLYHQNKTVSEIARRAKCSTDTVRRVIREYYDE